ncbi:MAG: OmpH family outer membrane protein [Firmicutes bacterium]|nr:OmpH family outer membrane protein [Bacillota bacterium]
MTKYLPWVAVILLGAALAWLLWGPASEPQIGVIDLVRIVDESPRAQELNKMLMDRYNELVEQLTAAVDEEATEEELASQERQAYAEYLAYRQELEAQLQAEVDKAVRQVAQDKGISLVIDSDVVRYGGVDISSEVIGRLK